MQLSLVVPAYNESLRLPGSLRVIGAHLAAQPYTCEIVVVDDGSDDDTFQVATATAESLELPVRVLRYERNRGKGWALKVGVAAAEGDWILFADADLSTPIAHVGEMVERLEAGAPLVIGSRKTEGARIGVRQPRLREWMGRCFTFLVRSLIADVTDATCGFKGFQKEVGKELFARLRVPDWSFDAEILLIARLRGYEIVELPVEWAHDAGTKVRLLRDALTSLVGLARIRAYAALGYYTRREPSPQDFELARSWNSPRLADRSAS